MMTNVVKKNYKILLNIILSRFCGLPALLITYNNFIIFAIQFNAGVVYQFLSFKNQRAFQQLSVNLLFVCKFFDCGFAPIGAVLVLTA